MAMERGGRLDENEMRDADINASERLGLFKVRMGSP